MEEGAVMTPLTGENLIPQGVHCDATAPQQNIQPPRTQKATEKRFIKIEDIEATSTPT